MLKLNSIKKFLLLISIIVLHKCSAFGKEPFGSHLENIQKSSNYDKNRDQFVNRRPDILEKMHERQNLFFLTFKYLFGGSDFSRPSEKLPELKPNMEKFLEQSTGMKFIWFGHSTFLVNIDGKILLFDPIFSSSAAPISIMIKRFQDAVIQLNELPNIDYIIISHDHYDHLDMETVHFFKDKKTKFLTPLGVGSHLKEWGIQEERISEFDGGKQR